jgi:hypothetical protein
VGVSAARKREARAKVETIAPIDPLLPGARARILARFPAVLRGIQVAPREAAALVAEYAEARDLAQSCEADREIAGNALALLVGDAEGLEGDGFRVTWSPTAGRVDWKRYAESLVNLLATHGVKAHGPDTYTGDPTRTLRVTLASGARR